MKFKVGDKVVSYTYGKGVVAGTKDTVIFPLLVEFNQGSATFTEDGRNGIHAIRRDLYHLGTTFEVKEPKVRGGWFNRVKAESGIGFYISSQSPGETKKAAYENRNCELFTYLGPPIYIEAKEGEAPATITLKKEPWAKIKDAMDVEHQGMCGVDCARCEYDELIAEAEA